MKPVLIHTCLLSMLWLLAVGPYLVSFVLFVLLHCSRFYTDYQSQSISLLMAALSDPETFLNVRRRRYAVFKLWPVLSAEQPRTASTLNLCAALEATWGHKANMRLQMCSSLRFPSYRV